MECEKVPKNKLLFLNITPCGITHEMNDCCCIPNLRNRYTFLLWVNIITNTRRTYVTAHNCRAVRMCRIHSAKIAGAGISM